MKRAGPRDLVGKEESAVEFRRFFLIILVAPMRVCRNKK